MTADAGGLVVRDLVVGFGRGAHRVTVLNGIDLVVRPGSTHGLVGESGSGKSTLAKAIVGTVAPASGSIALDGADLQGLSRAERARMRRRIQMIPQDPYASLDPRHTIGASLAEALDPYGRQRPSALTDRSVQWLETVLLPADSVYRYPHEFSGGQRQRIAIARALAVEPEVVVADEITSALDVSVQAEVLDLIADLRRRLSLTMLFISHNLAVVRGVSDDVTVLYHGDVVESASAARLFSHPQHPYTRELLAAVPGSPTFSLDTQDHAE